MESEAGQVRLAMFLTGMVLATLGGYLLRRVRLVRPEWARPVMSLAIIACDAPIAGLAIWHLTIDSSVWKIPTAGAAVAVAASLGGLLLAWRLRMPPADQAVFGLQSGMGNVGYTLGGALCFVLWGDQGLGREQMYCLMWPFYAFLFCFPIARHYGERAAFGAPRGPMRDGATACSRTPLGAAPPAQAEAAAGPPGPANSPLPLGAAPPAQAEAAAGPPGPANSPPPLGAAAPGQAVAAAGPPGTANFPPPLGAARFGAAARYGARLMLRSLTDLRSLPLYTATLGLVLNLRGVRPPPEVHQWHVLDVLMVLGILMQFGGVGMTVEARRLPAWWKPALGTALLKMAAGPVLMLGVGWALGLAGEPLGVCVLLAAMPTALYSVLMANLFGLNRDLANATFILTHALCLAVVVPVVLVLAG
jgi:predicted permease